MPQYDLAAPVHVNWFSNYLTLNLVTYKAAVRLHLDMKCVMSIFFVHRICACLLVMATDKLPTVDSLFGNSFSSASHIGPKCYVCMISS